MFDTSQIPNDVLEVCRRLVGAGFTAHLVGGGVRDMAIGRMPKDFDIATSAMPEAVLSIFSHRGGNFAMPTGLKHGTVTVLTTAKPARHVEVTTYRGDGEYLDGRRPSSVTFGKTLLEDLARRDFTMNAMALDPLTGVLHDPWGGLSDIKERTVRAVGDPLGRFLEDGLRPMRAVRQATQLDFKIDGPTVEAIGASRASFRMVSQERVRDELCKILETEDARRGVLLLRNCGLLEDVIPELLEGEGVAQEVGRHRFDVFTHNVMALAAAVKHRASVPWRLAALLHDVAKPRTMRLLDGVLDFPDHAAMGAEMAETICERLKFSNAERTEVCALVGNHEHEFNTRWSDGDVRRFIRKVSVDRVGGFIDLRRSDVEARGFADEDPSALIRERVSEGLMGPVSVGDLVVGGKEVMQAIGMPPGKRIGEILLALLDRVLDDPTLNTKDKLIGIARELAS